MYYIYCYLNPLKPGNYNYFDYSFKFEPFYIGKGKGKRINSHLKEAIKTKGSFSQSSKITTIHALLNENRYPIVNTIAEDLTEEEAFFYEWTLIKLIGRLDLESGPLTNLNEGILPKTFDNGYKQVISTFCKDYFSMPSNRRF